MPLEFYQLLLTKKLGQSRPAKAEISMGPLPWCCFALSVTEIDSHPPQAEKDADSLKTSQNCNCDWAPRRADYFKCHLNRNLLCMKLLSQVLIVSLSSCLHPKYFAVLWEQNRNCPGKYSFRFWCWMYVPYVWENSNLMICLLTFEFSKFARKVWSWDNKLSLCSKMCSANLAHARRPLICIICNF